MCFNGAHAKRPTLIFAGSTRQQSFNRKLAHATAAIARDAGASVTVLELSTLTSRSTTLTSKPRAHRPIMVRLKQALFDHRLDHLLA